MDILFDIGNVLLSFDFEPAMRSLMGENAQANAYEQLVARKDAFESGKIPLEEYVTWASSILDFHGSHEEFCDAWNSIFTPILPMWELAEQLHNTGHRLILFSNTNPIHAPYITQEYEVFQYFDGAVFSHEIEAFKPEDKFYEKSIHMYDLKPENTLYFDDLAVNIEGGKKHGFISIPYDFNDHASFTKTINANKLHLNI